MVARSTRMKSPCSAAASISRAPPPSICRAAAMAGEAPCFEWREVIEPSDQHTQPPRIASTPPRWRPPWSRFCHGAASQTTPAKPRSSAAAVRTVGRRPPGHAHSVRTMKSGPTPMSSAVRPDGTNCSAQTTQPLPPSRRKPPITVLARHWWAVGVGAPRSFKKAKSKPPATRKRALAMRKGGIVSTATRIPR